MKKVIMVGAGGHGRVIADIIRSSGDEVVGFLDDKPSSECPGCNIVGNSAMVGSVNPAEIGCTEDELYYFPGIGDNKTRKSLMKKAPADTKWYTAIHPSAVIAPDVTIDEGTTIMANVAINCGSKLGKGVIVNTGATIDHDNLIEDFASVAPGAHICGTVRIGEVTHLGAGGIVINNVSICGGSIIGAGAVVIKDIDVVGTYVGVPTRRIK